MVSALKRARTIWGRTANASKESAHATKVLDTILTKVSPPERLSNPQNDDNNRYNAAAAAPTSAKIPHSNSPSEQPDTPASSWSAVNNKAPSAGTAVARRDFSVAWDFGMDAFHTERTKKRDSDDPIDMAVNGDIDWVRLAPPVTFPLTSVSHGADPDMPERTRFIYPGSGANWKHRCSITYASSCGRKSQGRMALYRAWWQESQGELALPAV